MCFDFLRFLRIKIIQNRGIASKRRADGGGGSHRLAWHAAASKVKGVASEASLPLTFPSIPIINSGQAHSLALSAYPLLLDRNKASQYTSVNYKLSEYVLPQTLNRNHVERDKTPVLAEVSN